MDMPSNCNSSMGMGMSMTFHFGISDPILIAGWVARNAGEFFLTCLFFFVMAAMFEGLKYFREILGNIALRKRKERKCSKDSKSNLQLKGKGAEQDNHGERTPLVDVSTSDMSCMQYLKSLCLPNMSLVEHALHLVQTFLHVVQVAVAYVLMLVVMTYNLWLFFAVVFGFGVGYLIFGRLRMVQGTHMIEEDPCCN